MGLKDIFESEKQRVLDSLTHSSRISQELSSFEKTMFSETVLPLVESLVSQINQDPDMEASFVRSGYNGGYFRGLTPEKSEIGKCWSFDVRFQLKSSQEDAGQATLLLGKNMPKYACIYNEKKESMDYVDISLEQGRAFVVQDLIKRAAKNKALEEYAIRPSSKSGLAVNPT